eukprot:Skav236838  [mRNA]  locus=scaffold1027:112086:122184:+ [translate_table: standard]
MTSLRFVAKSFAFKRFRPVRGTGAVKGGGFAVDGDLTPGSVEVMAWPERHNHFGLRTALRFEDSPRQPTLEDNSLVSVQNARCGKEGGGFSVDGRLQVSNRSIVTLEEVTAGSHGGGFIAYGEVVIAERSTLNITNSRAESGDGGGFDIENNITVTSSTLAIWNARAGHSGGGFYAKGKVVMSNSTLRIQHASAMQFGGGFKALGEVVIAGHSTLNITNSGAESGRGRGGGFYAMSLTVTSSTLAIWNAKAADSAGGFFAEDKVVMSRSTLRIHNASAATADGGGFVVYGTVVIADMSNVYISNASVFGQGGGFYVNGRLQVSNRSIVSLENVTAGTYGGGFVAFGEVVIVERSTLNITNSRAKSGNGGGFCVDNNITVSSSTLMFWNARVGNSGGAFYATSKVMISSSTLRIQDASAVRYGGGFLVVDTVVIADMSNVSVSNATALKQGGGFEVDGRLQVSNRSIVNLKNVTAGSVGGGFLAHGDMVIAGHSTLNITNSRAESGDGGGFWATKSLTLTSSTLAIQNARSGRHGGGFYAGGKVVMSSSTVLIQNVMAMQTGGGFSTADHVELVNGSAVTLADAHAGADGGGFWLRRLSVHRSRMFINKSSANRSGTGGLAIGHVLLASESNLVVHRATGPENSSVLAAGCVQLRERSNIVFEDVIGGHGMDLRNTGCKEGGFCRSTFQVASDATVNASGRLTSGLLYVAACVSEKIRLAGIHLQNWSSPLLPTSGVRAPGHVVIDQVRIDYEPPVNNLPVLDVKDWCMNLGGHAYSQDFTVDSLMASCPDCAHGLTFDAEEGRLLALSPKDLQCSKTVTVKWVYNTVRMWTLPESWTSVSEPHSHFQNGTCKKCDLFSAWSDGGRDICHTLPCEKAQLLLLFLGTGLVVLMIFIVFEILKAPLTITEAKSTMAQVAEGKRSFTLAVQGPIVDLHKRLSGLLHRRISYYANGTDLQWLDSDQNSKTPFKVSTVARRKLMIESLGVPFDCAACKGSLHPTDIHFPLMAAIASVMLAVMLPIVIQMAATAVFALLPMGVAAALLHVPVAWFLRWLYSRTPFREALEQYEKRIQGTPQTGPDASHPYNQGLLTLTLLDLWQHFEGFLWAKRFILESNMHFVVANIVKPLTKSKQVSFVSLWGGRQVDYFVSHSWGTGFRHFVRSIHSHALSKEGPTAWTDAAYWICSFANNQWDIDAELGSDPMTSAFARVLTKGPKEVAMVLDKERVQGIGLSMVNFLLLTSVTIK